MFWAILVITLMLGLILLGEVIALTVGLIIVGEMGGSLIQVLLGVATVILVIQLFSLLFSRDKPLA